MEEPKLVTLIPEEEEEPPPPPPEVMVRKIVIQITAVICLKVATGLAIRALARSIKDFDILYPEHLDRINWKDFER